MRKAIHSLARLLDNVQRRFQRSRAGSVMILVVSLLVLMAIIGTAFLTTARNERYSSQLHESNVQVDMLLEGVKNILLGRMAGENFLDPNGQRWDDVHSDNWLASRTPMMMIDACGAYNPIRTYNRGDWVEVVTNAASNPPTANFYVSRVDGNLNNPLPAPGSQNNFWWGDSAVSSQTLCWEAISSLFDKTSQLGISAEDVRGPVDLGSIATFDGARSRNLVQLVFVNSSGKAASSVQANGQWYPAFRFYRVGDPNVTPVIPDGFQTTLAASASGNGIADSFLWRLPMGEINGVTYYAAVRVIDNNAAINLNTAGSSLYDFAADGNPLPNMAFFPGDVGIAELLSTFNGNGDSIATAPNLGAEFANLNLYRDTGAWNYNGGNVPLPDGIIATLNPNNLAGQLPPVGDLQGKWGPRPDFRYLSLADAQYMGLGRRIDLPGHPIAQSNNSYSTFSWGDSAALAYFFDLVNPATRAYFTNGIGSVSNAENVLAPSLVANYLASTPWGPTPTSSPLTYAQNWFNQNYVYSNPDLIQYLTPAASFTLNNNFNRRPLVVARNPQSNMMPVHVPEMDALSAWAPYLGAAMGYNYNPNSLDPTRGNLPRVSLNTADTLLNSQRSFVTDFQNVTGPHTPTLWLGFYNAMLAALEPPYTDPFLFVQQNYQTPASIPANFFTGPSGTRQLAQQFRSSLRDPNGLGPYGPNRGTEYTAESLSTYLPPASQLLVRSLIAAVNAKDIRDSDDDITSATIFGLPVVVGGNLIQTAKLTVYGTERQPFISEVYVNNDTSIQGSTFPDGQPNNLTNGRVNPNGYVAIELYNPYDVPISLGGWTVASMRHTGVVTSAQPNTFYYPAMAPRQIGPAGAALVTFPVLGGPVIKPKGFLVLENIDLIHQQTNFRPWWVYAGSWIMASADPTTTRNGDQSDNTDYYYIQNLENVLKDPNNGDSTGDELYLLRPRAANGNPSTLSPYYDESFQTHAYLPSAANSYLEDMVPVDSFDFCGINKSDGVNFQAWHYVRANSIWTDTHPNGTNPVITPPRPSWKFVFRGHWDPAVRPGITAPGCHEDGVETTPLWNPAGGNGLEKFDLWIDTPPGFSATPPVGGAAQPPDGLTAPICMRQPAYASSYPNPYPGIPLNNTGYGDPTQPIEHGINKNLVNNSTQTKFNAYPFGGFARNGDVLQTPFIGSYTITYVSGNDTYVLEMNPVTADAGFADDNNMNYVLNTTTNMYALTPVIGLPNSRIFALNNPYFPQGASILNEDDEEQVGRFVPLSSSDGDYRNFSPAGTVRINNGQVTDTRLFDTYGWAAGIFDYFGALQTPDDDYLPNSKPEYYIGPYDATTTMSYTAANPPWLSPVFVANSPAGSSTPNGRSEAAAPIEGLININTAPWKVLAQLPFTAPNLATVNAGSAANSQMIQMNTEIAQAIVRYRNTFGPFHSIFELNRVWDTAGSFGAPPLSYNSAFSNAFQNANGSPDANDYPAFQGVLNPNLPGFLGPGPNNSMNYPTDGLITDFNQREAEVMRLSNLLTTRSDSFTVYLQVQGWRGAGTPSAQLVVQRRAAFIMDRSGSTRSADNKSNTTNQISVNIPTKIQTE